MRQMEAHLPDDLRAHLDQDELPPVFVLIHESRSGSTFLADMLSRHPQISIAPESSLLRNVWRWRKANSCDEILSPNELEAIIDGLYREKKLQAWGINRESIIDYVLPLLPVPSGFVARMILVMYGRVRHPGSCVFGIKRGGWNAFNMTSVRTLLPRVRFIHIVRDGRAVYASEKRAIHSHTGQPFQKKATVAAWRWQHIVRSYEKEDGTGLEVRYEDLVSKPEAVLSATLSYLGVDPDPALIEKILSPHESEYVPDYVAELHRNVGKQPLIERIDAWRNELLRSEIRAFERIAGDTLVARGYARVTSKRPLDAVFGQAVDIQQRLNRRLGLRRWRKQRVNP